MGINCWNSFSLDDLFGEKMTTKVVYFTVGGKPEQAEFSSDFPADEIKGKAVGFVSWLCIDYLLLLKCVFRPFCPSIVFDVRL